MTGKTHAGRQGLFGRLALPTMGIALANLAALGMLIGMVGASRAYSVGVHTLLRDHLPAVLMTLAATALFAAALGRGLLAKREVLLVVGFAVAADVVAAVAATLVFDEMRRAAEIAIPRAILTETVAGLQPLAIAGGAATGYFVRSTSTRAARRDAYGR